ncbi:DUF2087 domain-containing protein [Planotetraspora kaengkrachanensis]|uniref:DUF2087 domain-containing protein n=1 Tax=Planotetraspora kaengkrachanensis TaxID=575193 RepID=A0A8J3V8W5_9ACTN|nr:DUF2087 domain-containing protein [Planotetraspora kaengkrachanensis]GIG82168.1 hypothetical protein Pka01_52950 [Planotetraspora kaengkrachanensis]
MIEKDVSRVLGLLGQDDTLRVFAGLVLRPGDPPDKVTGLAPEATERALTRLARGGLAVQDGDGWRADPEVFRDLLRATPKEPVSLLDTFLVDGRLTSLPVKRSKKLIVLDYVARVFEPGVRYSEKEVDVSLRAFHDDYAALRRYLVDEGFLSRENNVYWRSGGTV